MKTNNFHMCNHFTLKNYDGDVVQTIMISYIYRIINVSRNHAHRVKVDNSADAPTLSTLFNMMSNATTAQLADVPDDFAAIRAP